ncbi:MAG: hypothetical protein QM658_00855 [Gordonia sp. (in: high G+C Gram-positive bacteria)]
MSRDARASRRSRLEPGGRPPALAAAPDPAEGEARCVTPDRLTRWRLILGSGEADGVTHGAASR